MRFIKNMQGSGVYIQPFLLHYGQEFEFIENQNFSVRRDTLIRVS